MLAFFIKIAKKFGFLIKLPFLSFVLLLVLATKSISMPASLYIVNSNLTKCLIDCSLLLLVDGPSESITIKNNSPSVTALNVTANFTDTALDGKVSVNTCTSIAPGETCQLTFTPGSSTVPLTSFPIQGSNTTALRSSIEITDKPVISITAPIQQNRIITVGGGNLSLTVTNSAASRVPATNITVTGKGSCQNVSVDPASNCTSVAPGSSCNLLINSNTPYIPCTITVSGTNTGNSPTALVAFRFSGGLVFSDSGGTIKVVGEAAQEPAASYLWTLTQYFIAGAVSTTDGKTNTDNIVATVGCTSGALECAAYYCRSVVPGWDLPAQAELIAVNNTLCSNNTTPCNFGGFGEVAPFSYWTSQNTDANNAVRVSIPGGVVNVITKVLGERVRCIKSIP